jgi:hypothetical protein
VPAGLLWRDVEVGVIVEIIFWGGGVDCCWAVVKQMVSRAASPVRRLFEVSFEHRIFAQ